MMQLNTLITQHTWSSDYSLETWLMIQQWTARSRANTFSQSNLWLIGPSSAQDDYLTSPCYKNSSLWESDGYEVKGAGWSQDDVSQSQQRREKTAILSLCTSKRHQQKQNWVKPSWREWRKKQKVKPRVGVQEKAAGSMPLNDAKVKTVTEVKLPHSCEAMLRDADSPIQRSSVD